LGDLLSPFETDDEIFALEMVPILYIEVGTTTPPADIMTKIAQQQRRNAILA
jgi:hypothetical protein